MPDESLVNPGDRPSGPGERVSDTRLAEQRGLRFGGPIPARRLSTRCLRRLTGEAYISYLLAYIR